jgi:flagellar secretion chaperone FliS
MPVACPWKSYRQVATQTAPPGQLVLMLYEGAIRFLEQARLGFTKEDPAEFNTTINNNILRAQEIILELNLSLNTTEGGELAATLRRLYEYMDWRLMQSNIKKEEEGLKDVIRRLTVLREAWTSMLQDQQPSARSAAVPQASRLPDLAVA